MVSDSNLERMVREWSDIEGTAVTRENFLEGVR